MVDSERVKASWPVLGVPAPPPVPPSGFIGSRILCRGPGAAGVCLFLRGHSVCSVSSTAGLPVQAPNEKFSYACLQMVPRVARPGCLLRPSFLKAYLEPLRVPPCRTQ